MTTTEKTPMKKLGLAELIAKVGDDKILIEPVHDNIQQARSLGKKAPGLTAITLVTSQFSPNDLLALTMGDRADTGKKVGLLIWLPREDVDRVRREHDAKPDHAIEASS